MMHTYHLIPKTGGHIKMRLQKLADWFIPSKVTYNPESYRRALVLVYIHLALLIIGLTLLAVSSIGSGYNEFYFSIGIPLVILNLFLFRKTGSNVLIGNLMAGLLYFLFINASLESGKIYSDDFTWMIIVPLVAYLIANIKSGLGWTLAICFYGVYLLNIEKLNPQVSPLGKDAMHYFIANVSLFLATGVCVAIFQHQSSIYVKNLKHQRKLLQKQKVQIMHQTNQLQEAKSALIKSNKELEQYAYATSHDLKQPLRTVNSFAQLIKKQFSMNEPDLVVCDEYLDFILDGTKNMNSLIKDLLEYAKLTATSNVEFKKMSLSSIIDIVLQSLYNQIEESDAIINRTTTFPSVDVVPVKINQLFQNIISNSLKFKRTDVPLIINIGCTDLGSEYEIYIADNGIGIDEVMFERIFEPFTKLNSDYEYNGSGIGLATCKRIVDLHQGNIWVDSKKGNGTTFYFTIKKNDNNTGSKIEINPPIKEIIPIKKTG